MIALFAAPCRTRTWCSIPQFGICLVHEPEIANAAEDCVPCNANFEDLATGLGSKRVFGKTTAHQHAPT